MSEYELVIVIVAVGFWCLGFLSGLVFITEKERAKKNE